MSNNTIEEILEENAVTIETEDGEYLAIDIELAKFIIEQLIAKERLLTEIKDLKKYNVKGYIPDNIASVTMIMLQTQLDKLNKQPTKNNLGTVDGGGK